MRVLLGLSVLIASFAMAQAHPGVGIVQDSRGNVYFTDLKQVWKVTPDGNKSVAVPNVHTHELCIDATDNLYGEHLWYEGDASKKWGHRVWRLDSRGTVSDIIAAREGFRNDYSFVRDRDGNMYWADRGEKTVIKKRSHDGKIATHAAGGFRAVQQMTSSADGTLFLIDTGNLLRISRGGDVTLVADSLSSQSKPPASVREMNYHMGLWTDGEAHVYIAVAAERLVLRVDSDGKTTVVARSTAPWSPSGGMLDRDGSLWLLEYSPANAVRARHIGRDGRERIINADARK